ncbi:hypothetical protein A0J61_11953 [Choanephora cucurbitarum]|uniref:Uncharacterized protein n=1 Tax=Choanephora cucurbitarum TaxID=101091 RepID=A0A1C7LQE0_9FUNG|nr:hypothetical protein A0J61_11953 [Choanephora cucurbitarum]
MGQNTPRKATRIRYQRSDPCRVFSRENPSSNKDSQQQGTSSKTTIWQQGPMMSANACKQ